MERCALPRRNHIRSATNERGTNVHGIVHALISAVAVGAATMTAVLAVLGFAAPTASAADGPVVVQVRDYNFEPGRIKVAVNQPIAFQNTGVAIHRIVADDGSFDSRDLSPGTGFQTTVRTAGEVRVHCEIHPSMTAAVVVSDATSASTSTAAPTATTGPLPTKLADTGVGDTMLIVTASACLVLGFFSMSLHRRRQAAIASLPSEASWRAVTVGQRHHDDLIAHRRR